jgi:hypothetical protein
MKKLLVLSMVVVMAGSVFGQSPKKRTSFVTGSQSHKPGPTPSPPPISKSEPQGVIPRAIRGGNPLQMINPKAPEKYGTSAQSVVLDPDTGKWKGIKLFEIFF